MNCEWVLCTIYYCMRYGICAHQVCVGIEAMLCTVILVIVMVYCMRNGYVHIKFVWVLRPIIVMLMVYVHRFVWVLRRC